MPSALSLYIHVPWCIKKCPYCDFNSHKADKDISERTYIKALIQDLDANKKYLDNRIITTIFIGGGTPSLLSGEAYHLLFQHIKKSFNLSSTAEITLEANPGTVDYERFKSYFDCGVNRLSIGIQSFNDKHLKKLGRIHSAENSKVAIESAKKAGFTNFNLDLMHGLPNQSFSEAIEDVKTALSFNPPHLSWYQLTIEPNTIFHKTKPTLPAEGILADIEKEGFKTLRDYQHYEISAFCQADKICKHNENYWLFGDYLGIGAGAHSKISHDNNVYRFEKKRMPNEYMKTPSININQRTIEPSALPFEFMLMSSRLMRPIDKNLFETRTNQSFESIAKQIKKAKELQLITESHDSIQLTEHGLRFSNEFQELFI